MNRRSFLKGSLTLAGLGLYGCPKADSSDRPLQGQRRDPSFRDGHRLRDGDFPPEPAREVRAKGLILGGGISGLSAGWRWSRAGLTDYRLLELESKVGGNSRALTYSPTSAPIGAHYLPLPNTEAKAVRLLLSEMGVISPEGALQTEHLCHSRQERLFYGGHWYEGLIPQAGLDQGSLDQVAAFQAHIQGWRAKRDRRGRKIFALPLHFSSQEPEYLGLDKISFAHYVEQQGWSDPFLLWLLEYACRDDFGASSSKVSAWAGLHYFASRDGGGLGDPDDVLVWPEGNNRLAEFLRQQQKGQVSTGALVVRLEQDDDEVVVDYLDLGKKNLVRVRCEAALCCLPTFMRCKLLEEEPRPQFQYHPWLTANLVLDRTPQDLEAPGHVAWDNVLHQSESLGYVVATHQHFSAQPHQPTVWTWYRPFPEGEPTELRRHLLEAKWEDWADTVLTELEVVHSDIRQCCRQLDITILGHGMIRPSVDLVWGKAMAQARKPQGRIYFGHGDLSGMSLFEESQFRGVLAAETALSDLGQQFESYL